MGGLDNDEVQTIHGCLGIAGEGGELAAAIERFAFYGKPLDRVNIKEECGDVLWYIAEICNAEGWTIEELMVSNIAKLRKRFPDKFTEHDAAEENRDRAAERSVIEQHVDECDHCQDLIGDQSLVDTEPAPTKYRTCSHCGGLTLRKVSLCDVCYKPEELTNDDRNPYKDRDYNRAKDDGVDYILTPQDSPNDFKYLCLKCSNPISVGMYKDSKLKLIRCPNCLEYLMRAEIRVIKKG
jgi:NTP pyrophosphatase (non-canonical NTP hydrolase)/DNA-directed RNA polymerase subunit RPC12/RpoP